MLVRYEEGYEGKSSHLRSTTAFKPLPELKVQRNNTAIQQIYQQSGQQQLFHLNTK